MYHHGALNAFVWKSDDFALQIDLFPFYASLHCPQILYTAVWKIYYSVMEYFVTSGQGVHLDGTEIVCTLIWIKNVVTTSTRPISF